MSGAHNDVDPARQAGGYKAAINNPNVSEEKKDELRERLDDMGPVEKVTARQDVDPVRQAAGFKAALNNPNVSDEKKEEVKEKLDNLQERIDTGATEHDAAEYKPE